MKFNNVFHCRIKFVLKFLEVSVTQLFRNACQISFKKSRPKNCLWKLLWFVLLKKLQGRSFPSGQLIFFRGTREVFSIVAQHHQPSQFHFLPSHRLPKIHFNIVAYFFHLFLSLLPRSFQTAEDECLLRCCVVDFDRGLPTFQRFLLPP